MEDRVRDLQQGLAALREDLGRLFALTGDRRLYTALRAVAAVRSYLSRPLRVAVLGESNSGKSSLINMLLRESVVPAGAFAGVNAHLALRHGGEAALYMLGPDGARTRLTTRALAKITALDTRTPALSSNIIYNAMEPAQPKPRPELRSLSLLPGAMSSAADGAAKLIEIVLPHPFLRRAELLESRAFPLEPGRSILRRNFQPVDAAIWCTLATQAWKETERKTWRKLPAGLRREAFLLVTYKDAVRNAQDEAKILARLQRDAGAFFGDILLVSLRQSLDAIAPDGAIADPGKWERSGAPQLEAALRARLEALNIRRLRKSAALLRHLAPLIEAGCRHGPFAPVSAQAPLARLERLSADVESAAGDAASPVCRPGAPCSPLLALTPEF